MKQSYIEQCNLSTLSTLYIEYALGSANVTASIKQCKMLESSYLIDIDKKDIANYMYKTKYKPIYNLIVNISWIYY